MVIIIVLRLIDLTLPFGEDHNAMEFPDVNNCQFNHIYDEVDEIMRPKQEQSSDIIDNLLPDQQLSSIKREERNLSKFVVDLTAPGSSYENPINTCFL